MKQFLIVFPELDVEVKATLLTEKAPKTCEGFWEALGEDGIETSGKHAMYTGREISVQLPLENPEESVLHEPAEENLTCFPLPGDLLFTFMPKHAFGGIPTAIYDLGIFYGRDARTFFPMGWLPGNLFAQAANEEERRKLAEVGNHINIHGIQKIILKRI